MRAFALAENRPQQAFRDCFTKVILGTQLFVMGLEVVLLGPIAKVISCFFIGTVVLDVVLSGPSSGKEYCYIKAKC